MALVLTVALMGQALAAITWSKPAGTAGGRLGWNYSWDNGDPVLVQSASGAISAGLVSDYDKAGTFAQDGGPVYLSVYYMRTTDNGATFSAPKKLNGNYHADRLTLAASSGSANVYAFWMSQTKYYNGNTSTFDTTAPRYVYVRRNTNNGAATAWNAAVKLPGQTKTSRGDYLYSAASGANAYVVTTNTNSGAIWLWRTNDSGATWVGPTNVGSTTFQDNATGYVGGFSGLPVVAASGSNVVVAWTSTAAGEAKAVVSSNAGSTFGAATVLKASGTAANNGYLQAAGAGNRLVVSYTTSAGAFLRVYDTVGATWGAERTVVTFPDTDPAVGTTYHKGGEGAIIGLTGTSGIGISLSECNTTVKGTCNNAALSDGSARSQLVWRQSSNTGPSWSAASVPAAPTTSKTTLINNYGSVLYVGSTPWVLWNGHNSAYGAYNVQLRTGSGTP
jgi:hypothetical protein